MLPDQIRQFLEGTYSEKADSDAWKALKDSLDQQIRDQSGTANARTNPLVDYCGFDSDNNTLFGTRWGSQPTAFLVIARSLPRRRGEKLKLLNGETVDVSSPVWSLAVAKALHRNAVKLPRWQISPVLDDVPEWLAIHMQEAAIAVEENGVLSFSSDAPLPGELSYTKSGAAFVKRDQSPAAATHFEPFEEDGWF